MWKCAICCMLHLDAYFIKLMHVVSTCLLMQQQHVSTPSHIIGRCLIVVTAFAIGLLCYVSLMLRYHHHSCSHRRGYSLSIFSQGLNPRQVSAHMQ